ncbi:hypothetical protein PROPEN_01773 [Proteus penneri ATCC 35198]|nr:hypothetical protein PROPEN_01773 [Proteus penneri ATCC 35198]
MSGTNGVQPTNMGVVFLGQIKKMNLNSMEVYQKLYPLLVIHLEIF